jgi:AAA family ATP:ADP antiporter
MFILNKISKALLNFSSKEKLFIFSVVIGVFFISCDYAIIRPASTSIFLSQFSSRMFPYCWMLALPVNLFVVYIYNKLLLRYGSLKTFFFFILSIILMNLTTSIFFKSFPFIIFIQFIFKDIYILLSFKQLWSLIHSTIDTNKAKFLYGVMFGVGSLGSVLGGVISAIFATKIGSDNLFFLSLIFYLLVFYCYFKAYKNSPILNDDYHNNINLNHSFKDGFKLIKNSNFLLFILLIVIFMQISTAFLDYQFNFFLEKNISDVDLRTKFTGKLTSIINGISFLFQFLGGFLLIHFFGLKKAHLLVPILLIINSIIIFFYPSFLMATIAFVSIKSFDYSFFGIIREMLYIPLQKDEKYRAKAIIDVFANRSSKAIASLFLIFIQNLTGLNIVLLISIISMLIYFIWINVIRVIFKKDIAFDSSNLK